MLKVDKFLFCLSLEMAGLILGWLGIAATVLITVISIAVGFGFSLIDCQELLIAYNMGEDEAFNANDICNLDSIGESSAN